MIINQISSSFSSFIVDSNRIRYCRKREREESSNDKYKDIIVEKRLKEKSMKGRESDAFTIFINNTEAWLSIAAARDAIDHDEMPDFNTFWKGKESVRTIREARGTVTFARIMFPANITGNKD